MFHPIAGWYSDRLPRTSKRSYILSGRSINRLHRLPNGFWRRSKLHFRQFFRGNEKRRLSREYISQKPPENAGSVVQVLRAKKNIFFGCTPKLGHEKTPKPLGYRGFPVQYLFWPHNMARCTKKVFCFFVFEVDFSFINQKSRG